jgi:hypothetical protein
MNQKPTIKRISELNYIITDVLDLSKYPENLWDIIMEESKISNGRSGRKMCRMTDPGMKYTIGGKPFAKKNYTETVKKIQHDIEDVLEFSRGYFNTCTMNYYPNGRSGFRAHTDYMRDLESPMIVTMLTLGNSMRDMELINRRTKERFIISLPHNSLVLMGPGMQRSWLHGIPKAPTNTPERLSLSFRRQKVGKSEMHSVFQVW